MPETAPLPLRDALQNSSLALFIGGDLPAEVTGQPSRRDLAERLAAQYGLPAGLSLAEAAQRLSPAGGRFEFTRFLRDQMETATRPQRFHRQVAGMVRDFHIPLVVSAAYDDLLEYAIQEAGVTANRLLNQEDVHFIRPGRPTLVRLYGSLKAPDSLVVTARDHYTLFQQKPNFADELRVAFRHYTFLFLGYDLSDPDFRFIFDQVSGSRFSRPAYAVWPDLPDEDQRAWRGQNIVILPGGAYALDGAPPQAQPAGPGQQTVGAASLESARPAASSGDRYVIYIYNSSGIAIGDGARAESADTRPD